MFHLIFPFTQSTSNWCQLLAASAFYTLRSLRRTGACPMRLERFVFAYDRVDAFGSHSAFGSASFGSGLRSAHAPRCWIVGSNCRHADWPRRGRLADCFGFSQRSRECEKECGRGAGEGREAGCARPSTLLAWQQADAYLFIYFCYYLSLLRFFLFFFLFFW